MKMFEKVIDWLTETRKCCECGKRRKENIWKHNGNGVPPLALCKKCFGEEKFNTMTSM